MPLPRKKTFVVFKEADKLGPYDERPMLPDEIHLQICLSRNDRPQPFHLICEHDTLIAVFSGTGKVEFKETGIHHFPLAPGDHVYVPAGAPTRLLPETECVIMRYKPREAGLEGVAWYCESCGGELFRHVFDTRQTYPQEGYLAGTRAFNADERRRRCEACDVVHPAIISGPTAGSSSQRSCASEKNQAVSKAQLVPFIDALSRGQAAVETTGDEDPRAGADERLRDASGGDVPDDEERRAPSPSRRRSPAQVIVRQDQREKLACENCDGELVGIDGP